MWIVFAQATSSSAAAIDVAAWAGTSAVLGALINVGFAGLVGWYLLTKAIPKMQEDFTRALKEQQEKFDARDDRRRTEGKEALKAVMEHCEREAVRRDESFRVEMGQVQLALKDTRESLEEVRVALVESRTGINQQRRRPGS